MDIRHVMTPRRIVALREAQLISANKRRGTGKAVNHHKRNVAIGVGLGVGVLAGGVAIAIANGQKVQGGKTSYKPSQVKSRRYNPNETEDLSLRELHRQAVMEKSDIRVEKQRRISQAVRYYPSLKSRTDLSQAKANRSSYETFLKTGNRPGGLATRHRELRFAKAQAKWEKDMGAVGKQFPLVNPKRHYEMA